MHHAIPPHEGTIPTSIKEHQSHRRETVLGGGSADNVSKVSTIDEVIHPASHRPTSSLSATLPLDVQTNSMQQQQQLRTSAVNRDTTHLDMTKWMCLITAAAFFRNLFIHPCNFIMTRERCHVRPTTTGSILREAMAQNGLRTVYRGALVYATGFALAEMAYIILFEKLRVSLPFESNAARDALAGFVGDATNVLLVAPFEMVAVRQMTAGVGLASHLHYGSSWRTARQIVTAGRGPSALYGGMSMNLLSSPASAVWWVMYEPLKRFLYDAAGPFLRRIESQPSHPLYRYSHPCLINPDDNFLLNSAAGIVSSVTATTVFCPMLVVRTRLQMPSAPNQPAIVGSRIAHHCRHLWKAEGWRGFYKGLSANAWGAVIEGLLFSQVYEVTKLMCDTTRSAST